MIDLVAAGCKEADVARDLGVSEQAIYGWRRQEQIDRGFEPGLSSVEKEELLDRHVWSTRLELATALFDCLEIFHNRQRRHSSLGMLTPIEFETRQGA